MNPVKPFHRLDFDNDASFNKNIDELVAYWLSFVRNANRNLALDPETALL